MNQNHVQIIANQLNINPSQVENTLYLLHNGATIPFIARYRKDQTGNLNEVQIEQIHDLEQQLIEIDNRREFILKTIDQQGKLTPELKAKIIKAQTLSELEDLYLPFKPKRQTKAQQARKLGLEPLALQILRQQNIDPIELSRNFLNDKVKTTEQALQGARYIIAEIINQDTELRKILRKLFETKSLVKTKVIKDKQQQGIKYKDYFDYSEPVTKIKSHRLLAIFRAEKQGFIHLNIAPDKQQALNIIRQKYLKTNNAAAQQVELSINDAYNRLLKPSLENELRQKIKLQADLKAIEVFKQNLRHLLMAPPLGKKRVLSIDPGFKTGCKVVTLNEQGDLLFNTTIYPHNDPKEAWKAAKTISRLVEQYKIQVIALGNGTASRETERFLKKIRYPHPVKIYIVDESGASIYSASQVAREEFPDYDVTVRGAVSIGRRLLDPLSELVKIDPKSLGVGQYQHDVDQKLLKQALDRTVEYTVNQIGVDLNTASKYLLMYVSGIGKTIAENIVKYREQNGRFTNRKQLLNVKLVGPKTFQQAAGFLRITDGENPLDASAVHPESYYIVEKMAKDLGVNVKNLIGNKQLLGKIKLENYIDQNTGIQTLRDIIKELEKPGRDPRQDFKVLEFDPNIQSIHDLKVGMVVPGIVKNVTNFGAFIDIGIKENGLVHISEMADHYVTDPNQILHVHQHVRVKIISIDIERKRIGLSLRALNQNQETSE